MDDFQSKEYKKDHQYRLDVYNENGLVFSQEFDSSKPAYFALDAENCKYYRADIYDVTEDYIFAVGNPIWNEPWFPITRKGELRLTFLFLQKTLPGKNIMLY